MQTPFQLMAKPTGSLCNLDCKYCFYLEKPHLPRKTTSTATRDE